jgi:hypothetical protein
MEDNSKIQQPQKVATVQQQTMMQHPIMCQYVPMQSQQSILTNDVVQQLLLKFDNLTTTVDDLTKEVKYLTSAIKSGAIAHETTNIINSRTNTLDTTATATTATATTATTAIATTATATTATDITTTATRATATRVAIDPYATVTNNSSNITFNPTARAFKPPYVSIARILTDSQKLENAKAELDILINENKKLSEENKYLTNITNDSNCDEDSYDEECDHNHHLKDDNEYNCPKGVRLCKSVLNNTICDFYNENPSKRHPNKCFAWHKDQKLTNKPVCFHQAYNPNGCFNGDNCVGNHDPDVIKAHKALKLKIISTSNNYNNSK